MNNEELYNYIDLFRDKALNNKLIIFVGAGVSKNVEGMPSWSELVMEMAKEIGYSKCRDCKRKRKCDKECPLINQLSTDDFLKIPQYLYNKSLKKYNEILKNNIKCPKVDAPLSNIIFKINPAHIITTNYDHLLEDSSGNLNQYQVILRDANLLNTDMSKYIIKMHGDIDDLSTIILKEDDYLNYSQNHVLIELFVKSLLVDHTILFLGYSLNDYNIKLILSWINYMRNANKNAINKKDKIGYIVLDEKKIDRKTVGYFKANNIGIVNINAIPFCSNMPDSLNNEKGKRLYSFLKEISEPSIEDSILQLDTYKFVDYKEIMTIQKIFPNRYELIGGQLRLFSELDYNKIVNLLKLNSSISSNLKSIFITSGIEILTCYNLNNTLNFEIGSFDKSKLFQSKLFKLYILNQFVELEKELSAMNGDTLDYAQYYSLLFGYDEKLESAFQKIKYTELNQSEKVAYLHNKAALDGIQTHIFTPNEIINYINNIQPQNARKLFSTYLEIYDGSPKEFSQMSKALEETPINFV